MSERSHYLLTNSTNFSVNKYWKALSICFEEIPKTALIQFLISHTKKCNKKQKPNSDKLNNEFSTKTYSIQTLLSFAMFYKCTLIIKVKIGRLQIYMRAKKNPNSTHLHELKTTIATYPDPQTHTTKTLYVHIKMHLIWGTLVLEVECALH